MKFKNYLLIILPFLFLMVIFSCSDPVEETKEAVSQKDVEKKPDINPKNLIAKIGDSAIDLDELKGYLKSRPLRRRGMVSGQGVKDRLDELITSEVLYQEAVRQKIDQDPETRRRIRQILSQRLLDEKINRPIRERKISEEEIKNYFDEHKNKYSRPEQMRVANIFIAVPENATPEEKEEKQKNAKNVLAQALEESEKRFGFGSLVKKYSDKHPKFRKGDTGFFDREGKPLGLESSLVEAAFKLEKNREIFKDIIETPEGFHIIMRVGKRSPLKRELKNVAAQIERQIRREEFRTKHKEYIEALKEKTEIQVYDQAVDDVVKEINETRKVKAKPLKKKLQRKVPGTKSRLKAPPQFPRERQKEQR